MILTTLSAFAAPTFNQVSLTNETDVQNDGTLVEAFVYSNIAPGTDVINGIPFDRFFPELPGWNQANNNWCNTCPPPFNTFLDDLMWQGNSTSTSLTVSGLTVGETYRLQLIMGNVVNQTGWGETVQFQGGSFLTNWTGQPIAVVIEFTAEAPAETVVFPNNGNSQPLRAVLTAWALHATGPSPAFVEGEVNGTPGFAGVIDQGNGYNFRPTTIGEKLDAAAADYAGCALEQVAGTWVRGRSPRVQGSAELGDAVTGPNLTSIDVGGVGFSTTLGAGGTLHGSGADGRWFSGNFARQSSSRSIWYGILADCTQ